MHKFSAIIPTMQKNVNLLNILIDSIADSNLVGEIIVIDNSGKGYFHSSPKVRVLIQSENIYVNPAWNLGIKESNFDYFMLLNDDIYLANWQIEEVYNFITITKNCGLVGVESSTSMQEIMDDTLLKIPATTKVKFRKIKNIRQNDDIYWGVAIFGKRENYYEIPIEMKVYCGDDYLIYKNIQNRKQNYSIYNTKIFHVGSLTSDNPILDTIKSSDISFYRQLDINFIKYETKNKPLEWIFSIKNSSDKKYKIVTLCGTKFLYSKENRFLEYIFSIKPADDAFHYHIRVFGFKFNIRKDMDFPPTACSIKNINDSQNITYKHHTGIVFAAFTPDGIIPENTIEYLKELKKYSDYIVLVGDCPIFKSETKKIEGIVDAYMFKRHQEYDFGSYKRGFEILKRNKVLDNIDNLILCNDSVIYNGGSLEEFFINAKTNHFYGLTLNNYGYNKDLVYGEYSPHLQSYLLSISKDIFNTKYFSQSHRFLL